MKIFISYKRLDKDIVLPIVEAIKQKTGIDCWIDLEGIESGDQFQNVIIDAIDNADIVVFILSKNFIAPYMDEKTGKVDLKKQTFPEKEVMYALHHNKRLVPISIDKTAVFDCKWLEFNCSGLDCIDWSDIDQQNKLLHNLSQWGGVENEKNVIVYNQPIGTVIMPRHPGYACLNIRANKTCEIYMFGKQIGTIDNGWGELYLKKGRYELSFVTEDSTATKVINIPSVDYMDFIHLDISKPEEISTNPISNNKKRIIALFVIIILGTILSII